MDELRVHVGFDPGRETPATEPDPDLDRRPIMQAERTDLTTASGERIYEWRLNRRDRRLEPLAGDLLAIAGPDGLDTTTVAVDDDLPVGYRLIDDYEWENAVREREYRIDPHSR